MDDDTVRAGPYGRGERGRFSQGNRLANGNPNARKMFELRKAVLDSAAATPQTVEAVFTRLAWKALGDPEHDVPPDLEAMKVYLSYTIGRPVQPLELSGPEGSPVPLAVAAADPAVMERAREGLDAWRSELMERFQADRERIARMCADGKLPPDAASWQ